jgi:hypothetical protein
MSEDEKRLREWFEAQASRGLLVEEPLRLLERLMEAAALWRQHAEQLETLVRERVAASMEAQERAELEALRASVNSEPSGAERIHAALVAAGIPEEDEVSGVLGLEEHVGRALERLHALEDVVARFRELEWARGDWQGFCPFRGNKDVVCLGTDGRVAPVGKPSPRPHNELCPYHALHALEAQGGGSASERKALERRVGELERSVAAPLAGIAEERLQALRDACRKQHPPGAGGSAICACGAGGGGTLACSALGAISRARLHALDILEPAVKP